HQACTNVPRGSEPLGRACGELPVMKVTAAASRLSPQLLLDPKVIDEPYDFYRTLVETAPVWKVPDCDVVVASSFEAVNEAVNRSADFSSNLLALLYRRDDGTPGTHPFDAGVQALATADPPVHTTHRNAVFP